MTDPSNKDSVLYVVIGCDCDPDRPQYGGVRYDSRAPLRWRGVRDGIRLAREMADEIEDDFGNKPQITWCVRSDLQMHEIYGDCAWPYGEFSDLWQNLSEQGDEIAWHPHLWRWSDEHGCWYQEIEDEGWMRDCLYEGYEALSTRVGHPPTTSRMGWEFHNNLTMRQIDELGIKVDFSAVPGRFTSGHADKWGSMFNCYVDWRNTPEKPYRPSESDYRREAQAGERSLRLTEVPMSTFQSRLLNIGAHLRRAAEAKDWRKLKELLTVSNPSTPCLKAYITIHPYIFSRLAAAKINEAKEDGHALLVTAFHADEMLGTRVGSVHLYYIKHLEDNLKWLQRLTAQHGLHLKFMTPRSCSQ